MEEQWKLLDHCLNCEGRLGTPVFCYAPHCSRQEKVLHCTENHTTQKCPSHTASCKGNKHINETTWGGGGTKGQLTHQEPNRNTWKLIKMLTLFPTPCLQKSPPRPEWCLPRHLLACLWPCSLCGGKTEISFFNKRR